MKILLSLLKLARPKQWVKNVFVLTVLIFAKKMTDPDSIIKVALAFAAFCMASSAVYYINDYRDVEEDRNHPKKKNRPLASGALPTWMGLVGFLALTVGAVATTLTLPLAATIIVVGYLLLNLAYSLGLKHIVILDVLIIATGFVLRILAGAAALSVMPSNWLVLCGITISLFLGFTKRRYEVELLGDKAIEHRRVLAHYSTLFLDQMISIVTAATVVLYALYTVDKDTVALVGSRGLILSFPFVLYGIFRYLYLVYHTKTGGDPTRTVMTDPHILVTVALWGALCTSIILWGNSLRNLLS